MNSIHTFISTFAFAIIATYHAIYLLRMVFPISDIDQLTRDLYVQSWNVKNKAMVSAVIFTWVCVAAILLFGNPIVLTIAAYLTIASATLELVSLVGLFYLRKKTNTPALN